VADCLDLVVPEELPSALEMTGRGAVRRDAEDVDLARFGQSCRLEGRQGAGGLETAIGGDDDRSRRALLRRHHDDRPRRVPQDLLQRLVTVIALRCESKRGAACQQEQIAGLRLTLEHLDRPTPRVLARAACHSEGGRRALGIELSCPY
jgi:hypothetical protein